jgi:hypothetical protein
VHVAPACTGPEEEEPGTAVKLLPCDHEVTGSCPGKHLCLN